MILSTILKCLSAILPHLLLFLLAIGFTGMARGVFHTTFNNFLDDTYQISAATRGQLEFPRELPGLLVTVFAGVLSFLPESRVGGIALLCTCTGLFGLASVNYLGPQFNSWYLMILFMFIWSIGNHLIMPVRESIGMSLAKKERWGRRLSQVRTVEAFATIGGAIVVWVGTTGFEIPPYWLTYSIGALFALTAAILYLRIRNIGIQIKRRRLIIRRRYWVYYVLSLLFGARKQIFLTFAPWVLVRIFGQPPVTFAKLWIVSAL